MRLTPTEVVENVAINHRSASFLIDQANDLLKDVERAAKLLK